jgi:hypothetical protein
MGDDLETELNCPRCDGKFGPATVERGIFSSVCTACGHLMQGTFCPAGPPYPGPSWCVTLRWRGPRPALKDAALLRQLVPVFKDRSIPEVLQSFQGVTEWKEHGLHTDAMRQPRAEARRRGFQVAVDAEMVPYWPAPHLPPEFPDPRMTLYCVQLGPSFHESGYLLVTLDPDGDFVSIVSTECSEHVPLSTERGLQFLEELAALDPLGIPDGHSGGIDGITLRCYSQQATGRHGFTAWSPDARHFPRQHGFVMALYRLAVDVAREPGARDYLKQLSGYLGMGRS